MCCTHGWIRGWRMSEGGKAERRKGGRPLGINPCPRRHHLGSSFALVLSPVRLSALSVGGTGEERENERAQRINGRKRNGTGRDAALNGGRSDGEDGMSRAREQGTSERRRVFRARSLTLSRPLIQFGRSR